MMTKEKKVKFNGEKICSFEYGIVYFRGEESLGLDMGLKLDDIETAILITYEM